MKISIKLPLIAAMLSTMSAYAEGSMNISDTIPAGHTGIFTNSKALSTNAGLPENGLLLSLDCEKALNGKKEKDKHELIKLALDTHDGREQKLQFCQKYEGGYNNNDFALLNPGESDKATLINKTKADITVVHHEYVKVELKE